VRYLGVTTGEGRNYSKHCNESVGKNKKTFEPLKQLIRREYGYNFKTMVVLYKSVALTIIMYSSEILGLEIKRRIKSMEKLKRAQRISLLTVTGSYRTVPTDAPCIIAGSTPIEYEVLERVALYQHKQRGVDTMEVRKKKSENCLIRHVAKELGGAQERKRDLQILSRHQTQTKKEKNMTMHKNLIQILTGHGNFKEYLHRFGLNEDPYCMNCSTMKENAWHV
jgi:hypothetical protein